MKMALLGPAGTYSDEAGHKYDKNAEFIYSNSVGGIFDLVEKGVVTLGIVPVENQLNGTVGETLDNLFRKNVSVIDELVLPIRHILAGQSLDYKKMISHPQAIGQCAEFIKNRGCEVEECSSTAKAMEMANKDETYAAIGSKMAAEKIGLKILEENISESDSNSTRFFIISGKPNEDFSKDKEYKTSIAVLPGKDKPGLLFDILREFRDHDINLNKIESRPSKDRLGEYVFYIDLEGNIKDENVEKVLNNLKKVNKKVKVFGSYEKQY
jgi:prephenate dehydratase